MIWFTHRTPKGVALSSATLITGLLAMTYFVLLYAFEREFQWSWLILLVTLGFIISYGIIYFFIERFLYHKVKIIFKTIHAMRSSAEGKPKIQMSQDLLQDINSEVADWADEKIKELTQFSETLARIRE